MGYISPPEALCIPSFSDDDTSHSNQTYTFAREANLFVAGENK